MPDTHVPAAGEAMPAAEEMQIIAGRFSRHAVPVGVKATIIPVAAGETEILRLVRSLSPEKRRVFVQMLHLLVPVRP